MRLIQKLIENTLFKKLYQKYLLTYNTIYYTQ